MDYEQEDQTQDEGVMQRIKESPRTVSALIIILIVAAAIYAFSGNQNKQATNNDSLLTQASVTPEASPLLVTSATPSDNASVSPQPATPAPAATAAPQMSLVSAEDLAAQVRALPAGERTATGLVEKAQAGDSVTVLARRAATRWLSENSSGYAVTNEHRIYIEDYIKDHTGSYGLAIGQTETVPFDLIAQAVAEAGQLNEKQLKNLSQYTAQVTF